MLIFLPWLTVAAGFGTAGAFFCVAGVVFCADNDKIGTKASNVNNDRLIIN